MPLSLPIKLAVHVKASSNIPAYGYVNEKGETNMFILNSKKNVAGIGLFLIVIVLVVWANVSRTIPTAAVSTQLDSPSVEIGAQVVSANAQTIVTKPLKQNIKQAIPIEIQTMAGTPAEAAEVSDWYIKHGRHSASDDYDSYDQTTLEKLAVAGDMRAMHALARMYADPQHLHLPEYGFDAAIAQLWNAAAHGSTQAFTDLATYHEVLFYNHEKNNEAKKNAGLEAMALYKAQELRGDRWPILSSSWMTLQNEINPTSTEQQLVNSRAQQLYDELQEKRRALGLGNFDNSVPDTVKRFFENLEKSK